MAMREKILISWSGGKDSCLMLHEALKSGQYEVAALVCMVKEQEQRISMHGVPVQLLDLQAESLGLRLEKIFTTQELNYETVMERVVSKFSGKGIQKFAYGDLFLQDIRDYRIKLHARIGMECLFPIWKRDTTAFAQDFISAGYRAIVSCVDAKKLDISFAGRLYDSSFLKDLPPGVDPFDGPLFKHAIGFSPAPPVLTRFEEPGHDFQLGFCDLIPA
jgi:uncharacterized protein (TIGR00290 family)